MRLSRQRPPQCAPRSALPVRFLTFAQAGLALAWDASDLDLAAMHWLSSGGDFALRHHWLLERVLHDVVHDLALLAYALLLILTWRPLGFMRRLDPGQRLEIATGVTLSLLVVGLLKGVSSTSCPWDLQEYGGVATYISHWTWGMLDGGPGHCFPGGHASSAFAFLALALPWRDGTAGDRRLGQALLATVLLSGLLLGLAQTLRGAHYPSHTLWTALLCWLTALLNHRVWAARRKSYAATRSVEKPRNFLD